jgi:hypothetical protein
MANNTAAGMGRAGAGLKIVSGIVESLIDASREVAAARARRVAKAARRRRSASEAAEGVVWGALVARVQPLLKKRGEKAKLGRELGVTRQQIYAYFNTRTAAPDAERTLRLIVWLAQAEARAAAEPAAGRKA